MRALITLVLGLALSVGYGQTVGGAGWCKTSANPNTITSLRVVNQKNMCSNVWDTLARKMYYYDYALTVGSRWVEFIPLTPPIGAETVVTAGAGIAVSGIGSSASPYVVTNTGDLSTTNEIQHVDTLRYATDSLFISLYLDGRPQKKVYIPQSPGGIYGTSDTTTGNHIAAIAAGKTLTIRSQGDTGGGIVPFRIESNGSEPDITGFYANGDSLLISRSDTEFLIHSSAGITIMADGVLALQGDSILLNAVGPALSSEKTFLQITPGGFVKYTEGVSLSQTNLIAGENIAFAGDTIKATGGGGDTIWLRDGIDTYYSEGNVRVGSASQGRRFIVYNDYSSTGAAASVDYDNISLQNIDATAGNWSAMSSYGSGGLIDASIGFRHLDHGSGYGQISLFARSSGDGFAQTVDFSPTLSRFYYPVQLRNTTFESGYSTTFNHPVTFNDGFTVNTVSPTFNTPLTLGSSGVGSRLKVWNDYSSTSAASSDAFGAIALTNRNNTNNNWTAIQWDASGGAIAADMAAQFTSHASSYADIAFHTRSNTGYDEVLRITGGASQPRRVGVNDATPSQSLDVNGTARITGSDGTATALMGRDADGDISALGLSGLSIVSGVLTNSSPSGSGTTNYLPKWTGSTALGNSLVFDNGTNVGVGTASPSKLLHVEGVAYVNGNIELPTTTSTVGSIIVNNQRAAHFFNSGTFVGLLAGNYTQTGIQNTGIGQLAAGALTTGSYNSAFGYSAGELITSGYENTAFSRYALGSNTTGYQNVAVGSTAMYGNVSGAANTGVGYDALRSPSSGNYNTAIGANSLNSGGASISDNTAIGASSGFNAAGSGNVFIGKDAGYNETGSNTLYIDNSNTSTPLISGDFSTNRVGINVAVASLTQALHVSGNARVTGAYYDSNNDPGSSAQILSSTVTGTDWVAASTLGDNWGSQVVMTTGSTLDGNGTTGSELKVNTNGITANEIAADAVGSSEIATDAVGSAEIAANAVGSSELAATTVTAGTYGSATQVPVTTFDADGRATGVTNTTITGILSGLTATRIPFASAANALADDALLTWNNTTKRMSIGNTGGSPQAAIHVAEGSVASFEAFRAAATVSGNMLFTLTNANNAGGASNNILTQNVGGSSAGDPLHQYVIGGVGTWVEGVDNSNADKFIIGYESTPGSGSDWLTISTTGQVGIQNNAPAHALDVTGRATATLYQGKTGTPTHVFGTGAGTTPTLNSLTGSTNGIFLQFTTGTTPTPGGNIISITYPTAFTTTSYPVFSAGNAQMATDYNKFYVSAATATAMTLTANGTLAASTTYVLRLNISGR